MKSLIATEVGADDYEGTIVRLSSLIADISVHRKRKLHNSRHGLPKPSSVATYPMKCPQTDTWSTRFKLID